MYVNKSKKIADRYAFLAVILYLVYSFYYSLLSETNYNPHNIMRII